MLSFLHSLIRIVYAGLFLLVPLVFWGDTSELFEFNKMWLTYVATIIIACSWASMMLIQKRFLFRRTILDIPIALFLISQIISTAISLDPYLSWWGYYSRFNGGLLSTITYLFLYYGFATHLWSPKYVRDMLTLSLISSLITSLWGIPSHFGYDPTCLLFRGSVDTACWTNAFQPEVRIFSTLGQPAWMAAYLAITILLCIGFFFSLSRPTSRWTLPIGLITLAVLTIAFLFTNTRAGFLGLLGGLGVFTLLTLPVAYRMGMLKNYARHMSSGVGVIILLIFIIGTPFSRLDRFTLGGIWATLMPQPSVPTAPDASPAAQPNPITGESGGTDSGKIRSFVWEGAVNAWKSSPLIGTGVETFAFAFYAHKPVGHNLTSEWDYLYNKAHNEYLNFLTTTGIFGLGSYLLIIGTFLAYAIRKLYSSSTIHVAHASIVAAYMTILVTNFFGFSVVIVQLYLFLLPLFFLILSSANISSQQELTAVSLTTPQYVGLGVIAIAGCYGLLVLTNYWQADRLYAEGSNLARAGQLQRAYAPLIEAVRSRPDEPVYSDEASVSLSKLSVALAEAGDATTAALLRDQAVALSNQVVASHPNNVSYWKSRVNVLYTLAADDPTYRQGAVDSLNRAIVLSPSDPKLYYNLGLLQGQGGDADQAIVSLRKATELKPDYTDAFYALGLMQHQKAIDAQQRVIDPVTQAEAADTMRYILRVLAPDHPGAKEALSSWGLNP